MLIVKFNIESIFLVLFPTRKKFDDKCGDNDASVANFFLLFDNADLDIFKHLKMTLIFCHTKSLKIKNIERFSNPKKKRKAIRSVA